jgi:hypothetical protein
MAKVSAPLFSIDASGQFAKAIVFAAWKGIKYARHYVIPSNPNTTEQQVTRGYFSSAIAAWKQETTTVKTAWNTYANSYCSGKTGANIYVSAYTTFLRGHNGTAPTNTGTPPNMS